MQQINIVIFGSSKSKGDYIFTLNYEISFFYNTNNDCFINHIRDGK